jgi:flagellar hook-length control protein FliK
VDSQIGTDIAKLLGNLGKSTGSAPQTASTSDAGTAFKRALAASEQAQVSTTTGKHLPAASAYPQAASVNTAIASGPASTVPAVEQTATHTPLPGFDLVVVGDPAEQSAVVKFAQASGLSPAALAELFPFGANDAANPSTPEGALSHAVAQAIADWMAVNQGAERLSGAGQTVIAAGADLAELSGVTVEELDVELSAALAALFAGDTENRAASLPALAQAVAAKIKPAMDQWRAQLSALATAGGALAQEGAANELKALQQAIENAIRPAVAQWTADYPAALAASGVSEGELTARLAETVIPAMTASRLTGAPALSAELSSVVARWLEQTPQFERSVVSEQWLRDLTGSVMPDTTRWMAEAAEGRNSVTQLATQIAPQIAQALQALSAPAGANASELNRLMADTAPAAVRQAPALAAMNALQAAALVGTTQPELAAARASALSQPQPISVAITGAEWEGDRSSARALTSTLMQVVAPAANPGLPETTAVAQATLDRFALRSAGMRGESISGPAKPDALVSTEGVKTANVETVTALRDIVTARTLELARLGAQIEKSVTPAGTSPQTPMAGLVQGDSADASAARLVGQSDLSFRQNFASLDRAGLSDNARLNQFSLNQNPSGREIAGRALSEALGQRLAANIAAGHYRLTFNVNPKELGAIDVVMEMRDGRLDAQINTSNAVTRELLGDSLPRLRDALQQSGINLAQLQVGSDAQQGNAQGRNAEGDKPEPQVTDERLLADTATDVVSEDIELGLDLDSVDFWA